MDLSLSSSKNNDSTQPVKTVYMIDGSSYIYRAYHAVKGLSTSQGFPTNAVFGFTKMLIKLIEERKPQYIGIFFDSKGPTFRHQIYDQYKANRPPMPKDLSMQIQPIKDVTLAFDIPVVEMQGIEADDLIGTAAKQAQAKGFKVVMVTGDKDFIQLITDNAVIWDPMKDKTTDIDAVRQRYGFEPEMFVDLLGLCGDSSDNIPGVSGIGPKTAANLIKKFGSIADIYDNIDLSMGKKQKESLIENKDKAFLSRQLAQIKTDAHISFEEEKYLFKGPDMGPLMELFRKFEFRQLIDYFSTGVDIKEKNYSLVTNMQELEALISKLKSCTVFAIDTETTSKDPIKAELVGLSFSTEQDTAFYIPVEHRYIGVPKQLDKEAVIDALRPVLEDPNIKKVGQNIKYDIIVLYNCGLKMAGTVFDTMIGSYLINPSNRGHSLDQIASTFLGVKTISYEETTGGKDISFDTVEIDKAKTYSCMDADITMAAYRVLEPKLKENGLDSLMRDIEVPLIPVLMRMETNGILADKNILAKLSKSFEIRLKELEENIYLLAGGKFNIKSSQQLAQILFEKMALPVDKKTKKKTGYSTDVDVLTKLAKDHKMPALILEHRTLAKLKSTYTDSLFELINKKTGRIHTSFNQTITATGRLSSSNPNLQNIPVRTKEGKEIRSAFIPSAGHVLVSADYSQIELRILAHCSDDPVLKEAFIKDEDIHSKTAAQIFKVIMVDEEMRRQAKAINFGIIYGMSAFGLSKALGISNKMAQTYIDSYFAKCVKVKEFIDQTIVKAGIEGKTSTLMGRTRPIPDINSSNSLKRGFAERTAVNTPIQGTAADLIKLAMIKVDQKITENNLKSAMLLSVHDEILFETPREELDTFKELVKDTMENIWQMKVPLKVNIGVGENWAEAH